MSQQPAWLTRLSNRVCECINLMEILPVGCHYYQDGETWEVSIFIPPTEFVGGPHDGKRAAANFVVDVKALCEVFDTIECASWQAHQIDAEDDLGSHFAIIGTYQNRNVWFRILSNAPDHMPAGCLVDETDQRYVDSRNNF